MLALLIRSKSPLKGLADQIYGDIFNAKYEQRESANKGGVYYRAYGLFCDSSLIEYDENEILILTDSKALFKDEPELDEFIYNRIKWRLNTRDIGSEIIEI